MADGNDNTEQAAASSRTSEETHPELFNKVGNLLAGLSDDADARELAAADAFESEDGVETESEEHDTAVVTEDDDVATEAQSDTGEDSDDGGAASDDGPTLPAAIRRSLKAYQWSDDEIDEAFGRDPDGFIATASKIHATRVQETQQWAALGRQQREEPEDTSLMPPVGKQQSQPDPNTAFPDGGVAQIDFDKLAADSGFDKETLIKAFGPVATTIDAINAILPALNDGVQTVERNKQAELARQIDQFFQGDDMKPYTEFYGESWDMVDNDQVEHRNQVLELADHMIVGAAQHGRTLSPFEAMELAHHTVSSEVKDSVIRKQLAGKAQKRRSGISLKPTNKTAPPQSGPLDRETVVSNAAQRLREVFG